MGLTLLPELTLTPTPDLWAELGCSLYGKPVTALVASTH